MLLEEKQGTKRKSKEERGRTGDMRERWVGSPRNKNETCTRNTVQKESWKIEKIMKYHHFIFFFVTVCCISQTFVLRLYFNTDRKLMATASHQLTRHKPVQSLTAAILALTPDRTPISKNSWGATFLLIQYLPLSKRKEMKQLEDGIRSTAMRTIHVTVF